jgi:hypothetical protein
MISFASLERWKEWAICPIASTSQKHANWIKWLDLIPFVSRWRELGGHSIVSTSQQICEVNPTTFICVEYQAIIWFLLYSQSVVERHKTQKHVIVVIDDFC